MDYDSGWDLCYGAAGKSCGYVTFRNTEEVRRLTWLPITAGPTNGFSCDIYVHAQNNQRHTVVVAIIVYSSLIRGC